MSNSKNTFEESLKKLEKIEKISSLKKKISILKNDVSNISHMIFYGKKGNSKEIIDNEGHLPMPREEHLWISAKRAICI